jgi:hypothetical protein
LRRQVELIDIQLEQINEVGAERRFSGLICNRVHGHLPTRRKLLMMIMGGRAVALPDGCQAGIRAANTTNNASTLKVSVGPQISCAYFGIAASRNSEFIRNHLSLRSHSICEAVHTPCVRRREIDKNVMPVTSWSWRLGFRLNEGSVECEDRHISTSAFLRRSGLYCPGLLCSSEIRGKRSACALAQSGHQTGSNIGSRFAQIRVGPNLGSRRDDPYCAG